MFGARSLRVQDEKGFEEGSLEMFVAIIGGEGFGSPPSPPKFGGNRIGRIYIYRKRETVHERLFEDYF